VQNGKKNKNIQSKKTSFPVLFNDSKDGTGALPCRLGNMPA
jgi:hypothetical protein